MHAIHALKSQNNITGQIRKSGARYDCLPSGVSIGINENLANPNALFTVLSSVMSECMRGLPEDRRFSGNIIFCGAGEKESSGDFLILVFIVVKILIFRIIL